jgi:uncharacterized membrane protein
MSTAIEQSVVWMTELHSNLGKELMSLSNRLASWLLLGNVGALVLMFNAKLGEGFIERSTANHMIYLFCAGLGAAFLGILVTFVTTAFGYIHITNAVALVHQMRVNEQYIKELESEGIKTEADSYFYKQIDDATQKYKRIPPKAKMLWIGVGLAFLLHACSAIAFGYAIFTPIN